MAGAAWVLRGLVGVPFPAARCPTGTPVWSSGPGCSETTGLANPGLLAAVGGYPKGAGTVVYCVVSAEVAVDDGLDD